MKCNYSNGWMIALFGFITFLIRLSANTFSGIMTLLVAESVCRGAEALNQIHGFSTDHLSLTRLFCCHDSGPSFGRSQPRSRGQEEARLLSLTSVGKFEHLISFLGKLHHCTRDVSPPSGCFFFQKGFGSQLSCQGAPEISQGPLKAGGQRPLTLPCSEWLGGVISSSADWSY